MRKEMCRLAAALLAAGVMFGAVGCSGNAGGSGAGDSGKGAAGVQTEGNSQEEKAQPGSGSQEAGADAQEGGEKGQAGADQLERIRQKGQLVAAMEGTWSPWTYHDEDDRLVGYDVEVAQLIGEKLGVEVVFVEGEWDGLFAGLDAGRYDLVVNGVEITEERGEKYDFSAPYAYIRTAIVVNEDNEEIRSFEDLDGKKTANTISSTYAELAESYGLKAKNVDYYAAHAEIGEGEGNAVVMAHLDVVPAGEGWSTDPFTMVIKDGKAYGRGVTDNKGAAIVALHCLRALKDAGVKGNRKLRVIFGSGEEVGMADMGHYFSKE